MNSVIKMDMQSINFKEEMRNSQYRIFELKCTEEWDFLHFEFKNMACFPYTLDAIIETQKPLPEKNVGITLMNTEFQFEILSHVLIEKNMKGTKYIIFLAHKAALLKSNINCTIFFKKTLKEVINKVAGPNTTINIKNDAKIELFVQYEESDLAFLNRLLSYYNCFWYCGAEGNIIVVDKELDEKQELKDAILIKHDTYFTDSKVKVTSYNAKNPIPDAFLLAEVGEQKYNKHYYKFFDDSSAGKTIANYIHSQEVGDRNWLRLPNMEKLPSVLSKIDFSENIKDEIIHFIEINNDYIKILVSKKMPKIQFDLPTVPSFFKAIVVGEKQLDYEENRIKIVLPFDGKTQIPATILQTVCAKDNQSFFVPAKGDEVIVSFFDINLTSVVMLGAFFNVANKSKFAPNEFGYIFSNDQGENKFLINKLDNKLNVQLSNQGDYEMECGGKISVKNKKGDVILQIEEGNFSLEGKKGNLEIKTEGNQSIKISEQIEVECKKLIFNSEETVFSTKKKFSLEAESIDINAKKDYKVSSGSSSISVKSDAIELKSSSSVKVSGGEVSVESKGSLDLKGSKISFDGDASFASKLMVSGPLTAAIIENDILNGKMLHGTLGAIQG